MKRKEKRERQRYTVEGIEGEAVSMLQTKDTTRRCGQKKRRKEKEKQKKQEKEKRKETEKDKACDKHTKSDLVEPAAQTRGQQ